MNITLLYESKTGLTLQVAGTIAAELEKALTSPVKVAHFNDAAWDTLTGTDLLLLGSPTHGGTLPTDLKPHFEDLPAGLLAGAQGAVFTTIVPWIHKMKAWREITANKDLSKAMETLGVREIQDGGRFAVTMQNPPKLKPNTLEEAAAWANALAARLTGA